MEVSDLSVSRVNLVSKCMRAYEFSYVHKLPEPMERAATVFGSVVHRGVQGWYEGPDYRSERLRKYVEAQWWELLPRDVAIALRHMISAEREVENLAQLISISRTEIKQPRMTKSFLTSPQSKRFEDVRDELLAAQDACETMAWPKDENAFQAYGKSLEIADKLELRWRHLPPPIAVEREFWVDLDGVDLRIHGFIDQIRQDPDSEGQVRITGHDLKTGRQPMTSLEMFVQSVLYNEACYQLPELPIPDVWEFLHARKIDASPAPFRIDRERHLPLAERILRSVKAKIESEDWTPSFGFWCKSCGFRDLCEQEIGFEFEPVGEAGRVAAA